MEFLKKLKNGNFEIDRETVDVSSVARSKN